MYNVDPKDLANITLVSESHEIRDIVNATVSIGEHEVVKLMYQPIASRSLFSILDMNGITATPDRFKQTFGHTSARMVQFMRFWDETSGDAMHVSNTTTLGRDIQQLQLQPLMWLNIPYFHAVFNMPFRSVSRE
jgi:hypothetical protein